MTRRTRRRRRGAGSQVGRWSITTVVALAIASAGVLILLGNQTTAPALLSTVATEGNSLGPAAAPVQVEEWGDFQ